MVDFVAFPIFDSTLQLVDSSSMVFLLYSLVRSCHDGFGSCFTFFEVPAFFKVEIAFYAQILCNNQHLPRHNFEVMGDSTASNKGYFESR